MKQLLLLITCVGLTGLGFVVSCIKVKSEPDPTNQKPIARAGNDILVQLLSCKDTTGKAELDGTGSFDPDSNIVNYTWKQISGSGGVILSDANSSKPKIKNISYGDYIFELTVTDKQRLTSKDSVSLSPILKDYSIDTFFNVKFVFVDNYYQRDYYFDGYYDFTEIIGKFEISPLGEFSLGIHEYTDTAGLAYSRAAIFEIYKEYNSQVDYNAPYVQGESPVNFKKLIQKGGGAFNNTINLTYSSSDACNHLVASLPPLTINGNLDVKSGAITFRIKGKVFL